MFESSENTLLDIIIERRVTLSLCRCIERLDEGLPDGARVADEHAEEVLVGDVDAGETQREERR